MLFKDAVLDLQPDLPGSGLSAFSSANAYHAQLPATDRNCWKSGSQLLLVVYSSIN